MKRPLILITNDDGIYAKGITELIDIAREMGDVVVVAPDRARSAQSSALTITVPMMYETLKDTPELKMFACTGTPADCIKLALSEEMLEFNSKPDLIISGINHGSNASINIIYSGTLGAAIEGSLHGIPSIGFSLCDHTMGADFSHCKPYFRQIVKRVLEDSTLPKNLCLNVNAPAGELKGMRLTRQSSGSWHKEIHRSEIPFGGSCYWMTGWFKNDEPGAIGTDETALSEGFVSIQPVSVDMTNYQLLKTLDF